VLQVIDGQLTQLYGARIVQEECVTLKAGKSKRTRVDRESIAQFRQRLGLYSFTTLVRWAVEINAQLSTVASYNELVPVFAR